MRDANAEISMLRQRLRFKNLSEEQLDHICDSVATEISRVSSDLLADAMNEAVNVGGDVASIDFIDELRAIRSGSHFEIITDSGNTDFSEAPFPMLPRLLKNAKVAKDGSLYKVIPIRGRSAGSENTALNRTTESAIRAIQASREQGAKSQEQTSRGYASPDATKGMSAFASTMNISRVKSSASKNQQRSTEPVIDFRTASSKQDPNTQWVLPGKNKNISNALRQINSSLQDSIDRVIEEIIKKYEGGF
jgi:hypothetical protein